MTTEVSMEVRFLDAEKQWADVVMEVAADVDSLPDSVPRDITLSVIMVDGEPVPCIGNPRKHEVKSYEGW